VSHAPRPTDDAADELGLGLVVDYVGFVVRATMRHKLLAGGLFVIVAVLAALSLKVVPFRYQVQAKVLAQRNPMMAALSNPGMNRDWDAPARGAREVVIRRENLVSICKETHFVERYLATRAPAVRARDWVMRRLSGKDRDPDQLLEGLVDSLEDRLWVTVGQEGAVTFTFTWSNPQIAFDIVQAAMDSFLEERYSTEIKAVGETIAILEEHDAQVQREIATTIVQAEQKEQALRIRSPARRTSPVRARVAQDEELGRIESRLASRRRALSDLESFRQQRLAELQAQLLQQQGIYAPQHPALATTRQTIESLSAPSQQIVQLRGEVQELEQEVVKRGGTRAADAGSDALAMQGEVADARLRLEVEDPRLEYERRQLALLVRKHSNLIDRIDSARVEMDAARAAFKYRYSVLTPPQLPKKPVKPSAAMILIGGLLGGLALGVFSATVADLRTGRVLEAWQVERGLGLPVIGEVRRGP